MIAATQHDRFAYEDYRRLANIGIRTARDGIRWHLIEAVPNKFDFSSVERQMDAANKAGVRVIWDLFHYGYPESIDIFSDEFKERFAALAYAFAEFVERRSPGPLFFVPVNEISFFAYIAGDIGRFYPYGSGRGDELKRQLVRAAVAAIEAVRSVLPDSRIVLSEPATNITARPEQPEYSVPAERYRTAQYEAFDMLSGRLMPELGGRPEYLDIIGVNYYPHNQWFYPDREMIALGDPLYRPFSEVLVEIYDRYRRPMIVSETGTEDDRREGWFRYVSAECRRAVSLGVELAGVCLYPIVNHPGWDDERHCHNGLWDYCDREGERPVYEPLAREIGQFDLRDPVQAACASSSRTPLDDTRSWPALA